MNWGILTAGRIARSFARDLGVTPGARVGAVGARSLAAAEAFAREYGGDECAAYGSYDELVADPDIDVVYVASPHSHHLEHASLALRAGKHVLCEKSLALNAADAEEMMRIAREHDRFLMEAMWTACHPLVRQLLRRVAAGDFGEIRQVHADLGFVADVDPTGRIHNPALGGGALLDVGIYPLTFAHLLLGEPSELRAVGTLSELGVDVDVAIAAGYSSGATAALTASFTCASPRTATIATTTGRIDVPADFHHPVAVTWTPITAGRPGDPEHLVPVEPLLGVGYGNEAKEVMRCIEAGLRESPLVPHAQTLAILRQLDELRGQLGVRYAADAHRLD